MGFPRYSPGFNFTGTMDLAILDDKYIEDQYTARWDTRRDRSKETCPELL